MADLEHGLIERLQHRYPALNVAELAERLEGATNPSAVLVSRCKAAAKAAAGQDDGKAKEADQYTRFAAQPDWIEKTGKGGWNQDGSFNAHGDYWNAPSGSVTRFIRRLVWLRRNTPLSPREAAMLAESHGMAEAFPSRRLWVELPETWQWAGAVASTCAESAVRQSGLGTEHEHPGGWRHGDPLLTAEQLGEAKVGQNVTLQAQP